jgi:hypothetical protein
MRITPFPPLIPKSAVDDASFKTSIFSMSCGFKKSMLEVITPSTKTDNQEYSPKQPQIILFLIH